MIQMSCIKLKNQFQPKNQPATFVLYKITDILFLLRDIVILLAGVLFVFDWSLPVVGNLHNLMVCELSDIMTPTSLLLWSIILVSSVFRLFNIIKSGSKGGHSLFYSMMIIFIVNFYIVAFVLNKLDLNYVPSVLFKFAAIFAGLDIFCALFSNYTDRFDGFGDFFNRTAGTIFNIFSAIFFVGVIILAIYALKAIIRDEAVVSLQFFNEFNKLIVELLVFGISLLLPRCILPLIGERKHCLILTSANLIALLFPLLIFAPAWSSAQQSLVLLIWVILLAVWDMIGFIYYSLHREHERSVKIGD